ncbi:hypothetical protein A5707_06335 [Mycobacterium kyorinense]|uniref:Uncharacterized protein n=1 Tax=Mycobacterium kyorinense TaxID=487514 RepID=A0A1A2YZ89_9MYCO|nr:hypothetical protein A5707_06335 [Mycobacterium kyorinense]
MCRRHFDADGSEALAHAPGLSAAEYLIPGMSAAWRWWSPFIDKRACTDERSTVSAGCGHVSPALQHAQ